MISDGHGGVLKVPPWFVLPRHRRVPALRGEILTHETLHEASASYVRCHSPTDSLPQGTPWTVAVPISARRTAVRSRVARRP